MPGNEQSPALACVSSAALLLRRRPLDAGTTQNATEQGRPPLSPHQLPSQMLSCLGPCPWLPRRVAGHAMWSAGMTRLPAHHPHPHLLPLRWARPVARRGVGHLPPAALWEEDKQAGEVRSAHLQGVPNGPSPTTRNCSLGVSSMNRLRDRGSWPGLVGFRVCVTQPFRLELDREQGAVGTQGWSPREPAPKGAT